MAYCRPVSEDKSVKLIVNHAKDRMELSGMRWTLAGADALLALRAVNENDDWDEFHAFRRAQCHKQLYGTPLSVTWSDQFEHLDIKGF
jgi:hypothetical protein